MESLKVGVALLIVAVWVGIVAVSVIQPDRASALAPVSGICGAAVTFLFTSTIRKRISDGKKEVARRVVEAAERDDG